MCVAGGNVLARVRVLAEKRAPNTGHFPNRSKKKKPSSSRQDFKASPSSSPHGFTTPLPNPLLALTIPPANQARSEEIWVLPMGVEPMTFWSQLFKWWIALPSLFQALRLGKTRASPLPSFPPFYFLVCAFSLQRTRLSRNLEQAKRYPANKSLSSG